MSVYDIDPDSGAVREPLVLTQVSSYTAWWTEIGGNASGSWNPVPFDQAKKILADQMRRNAPVWLQGTAGDHDYVAEIEAAS